MNHNAKKDDRTPCSKYSNAVKSYVVKNDADTHSVKRRKLFESLFPVELQWV
jgi:hypothetical protein